MGFHNFFAPCMCLMASFSSIYGNNLEDTVTNQSFQYAERVISFFPEVVKTSGDGKVYLDERRIIPTDHASCMLMGNEMTILMPLSLLSIDSSGSYLSVSADYIAKKPFKNVCNRCNYEWEGGAFTWRCPNCNSTDIRNVLNI